MGRAAGLATMEPLGPVLSKTMPQTQGTSKCIAKNAGYAVDEALDANNLLQQKRDSAYPMAFASVHRGPHHG